MQPNRKRKIKFRGGIALFLVFCVLAFAVSIWLPIREYRLSRELFYAIHRDDSARVIQLLDAGADPNLRYSPQTDGNWWQRIVKRLLHREPQNNQIDSRTPLQQSVFEAGEGGHAAKQNDTERVQIVRALLEQGADPNVRDARVPKEYEWCASPLYDASQEGDPQIVALLLQHGAHTDVQNRDGKTPLHRAVGQFRLEPVTLLLKAGANINARDFRGYTPLHDAYRSVHCLSLLLANHADINARTDGGETPLIAFVKKCKSDNDYDFEIFKTLPLLLKAHPIPV